MQKRIRKVAAVAGIVLSLACGAAGGVGRPSFDELVVARHRADPWSTDPCGAQRHMVGVCRLLRPVRG